MTFSPALFIVATALPGRGVLDRLGGSVVALGEPLLYLAFVVFGFVLLFRYILPGWVGAGLALLIIGSVLWDASGWFDWMGYVATGNTTEAPAAEAPVVDELGGN
ncbi:MAG: hypothetical protein AAF467_27320 [Actinomycetota bacterium]